MNKKLKFTNNKSSERVSTLINLMKNKKNDLN